MSRFVSNVSKMFPKVETGFHQSYQCVVRENRICFHVSTPGDTRKCENGRLRFHVWKLDQII